MKKGSKAPEATHSVDGGKNTTKTDEEKYAVSAYQQSLFLNMALNMGWQLALVVIIPIVGGYELDRHFNSSPWLTIAGVVIAGVGFVGVLIRVVKLASVRSDNRLGSKK
jgi:F0F1-type ATP synthase assembly protein I